jgi:hypothetical protein
MTVAEMTVFEALESNVRRSHSAVDGAVRGE